MTTNSEAILWLDGLCDGALDLIADNAGKEGALDTSAA
jgi:hypothetical protein